MYNSTLNLPFLKFQIINSHTLMYPTLNISVILLLVIMFYSNSQTVYSQNLINTLNASNKIPPITEFINAGQANPQQHNTTSQLLTNQYSPEQADSQQPITLQPELQQHTDSNYTSHSASEIYSKQLMGNNVSTFFKNFSE